MSDKHYEQVARLLRQTGRDSQGQLKQGADAAAEQALILKALAVRKAQTKARTWDYVKSFFGKGEASNSIKEIAQFAHSIRGFDRSALMQFTTVQDIHDENTSGINPDSLNGAQNDTKSDNDGLFQRYTDSCVPTTAQIVRGEADPIYALGIHRETMNNPSEASSASQEQHRVLEQHGGAASYRAASQIWQETTAAMDNTTQLGSFRPEQRTLLERMLYNQQLNNCLLYTSPSPRDATLSRMPSSA